MAKGIDVSKWNEEIDWKKVKDSGIEFAMIREGYGRNNPNQIDKNFHTNIKMLLIVVYIAVCTTILML